MSYQPNSQFGVDDRLACPQCGHPMHIIRRTPHNELGGRYEHQTFICRNCRNQIERSADRDGKPG